MPPKGLPNKVPSQFLRSLNFAIIKLYWNWGRKPRLNNYREWLTDWPIGAKIVRADQWEAKQQIFCWTVKSVTAGKAPSFPHSPLDSTAYSARRPHIEQHQCMSFSRASGECEMWNVLIVLIHPHKSQWSNWSQYITATYFGGSFTSLNWSSYCKVNLLILKNELT